MLISSCWPTPSNSPPPVEGFISRPERRDFSIERLNQLQDPEGFQVQAFATQLGNVRVLVQADDGTVYATRSEEVDVLALSSRMETTAGPGASERSKWTFTCLQKPPGVSRETYCEGTLAPALTYQAHSSPLGLVFYDTCRYPETTRFSQEYNGDAFVTFRGSWNRQAPVGSKVVRVRFENGKPVGFEDFVTGFLIAICCRLRGGEGGFPHPSGTAREKPMANAPKMPKEIGHLPGPRRSSKPLNRGFPVLA